MVKRERGTQLPEGRRGVDGERNNHFAGSGGRRERGKGINGARNGAERGDL